MSMLRTMGSKLKKGGYMDMKLILLLKKSDNIATLQIYRNHSCSVHFANFECMKYDLDNLMRLSLPPGTPHHGEMLWYWKDNNNKWQLFDAQVHVQM